MIVIADTSPINYLILIREIDVLPALYGRILTPVSVCEELQRPRAADAVRLWMSRPPSWFEARVPSRGLDAGLATAGLDAGEREAILLAEELGADQLIVDEIRARRIAQQRRIPVTG